MSDSYNDFHDVKQKIFKGYFTCIDMFEWMFKKKSVKRVEEDTKKGFEKVREDISGVGKWIKHLNSEKEEQKNQINDIKEDLSSIKEEIEGIKNMISIMGNVKNFKQPRLSKQLLNKQTAVEAVQTAVQTAVYTPNLDQFSISERAIIWVLLNSDMKLSYEDIAAMLGKEKSTVRSQINAIKQKSEIIEEYIERNGKKRVFIPENIREIMLKKSKVRVSNVKKRQKDEKN